MNHQAASGGQRNGWDIFSAGVIQPGFAGTAVELGGDLVKLDLAASSQGDRTRLACVSDPDSFVTDVRVIASRGGVSVIAMQSTAGKGTTFTIVSRVAMMTDGRIGVEHSPTRAFVSNCSQKPAESCQRRRDEPIQIAVWRWRRRQAAGRRRAESLAPPLAQTPAWIGARTAYACMDSERRFASRRCASTSGSQRSWAAPIDALTAVRLEDRAVIAADQHLQREGVTGGGHAAM
jgi:hypothetical protein